MVQCAEDLKFDMMYTTGTRVWFPDMEGHKDCAVYKKDKENTYGDSHFGAQNNTAEQFYNSQ